MKKIIVTFAMTLMTMTAMALHPIDQIPWSSAPQEVIDYIINLGYTNVELDETDEDGIHSWGATNPKDNSSCLIRYNDDNVEIIWFRWKNESVMPRLHRLEDLPHIWGDGYYTIGKWKNNYIFNVNGGNFLDAGC